MTNLNNYMNDGACSSARAVLALISDFNIEDSYNNDRRNYDADINVSRWQNCREQGYVLTLRSKDYSKQLNIAFFEHRNSDSICTVEWEQVTTNAPTIDTAEFGEKYKTKWDTDFVCKYDEHYEMAQHIKESLTKFWDTNS
jgi:hypothetical protein